MNKLERTLKNWSTAYAKPALLNKNQKMAASGLAVLLLVMAILQLLGFSEFKDALTTLGMNNGTDGWAVVVVIAEVWGALSLIGVRMNGLFRAFGRMFAVFATGFWFIITLQTVSGIDMSVSNSAFFGKYLTQVPGWWTVIEATILMIWTIYVLEVTKQK